MHQTLILLLHLIEASEADGVEASGALDVQEPGLVG